MKGNGQALEQKYCLYAVLGDKCDPSANLLTAIECRSCGYDVAVWVHSCDKLTHANHVHQHSFHTHMCVVHMLGSQVYGLPLLGQPHYYYYYLLITKRHGEQVQRHSQQSGWCRWTVYRAGRRTRRSRNAGTRAAWSRGTAPVPSHRSSAAPGSSRGARTGAVDSSRRPRSSTPQPRTPLAADPTHIVSIYTRLTALFPGIPR